MNKLLYCRASFVVAKMKHSVLQTTKCLQEWYWSIL